MDKYQKFISEHKGEVVKISLSAISIEEEIHNGGYIANLYEKPTDYVIVVRPTDTDNGKYALVCGWRQYVMARYNGMRKIDCIVVPSGMGYIDFKREYLVTKKPVSTMKITDIFPATYLLKSTPRPEKMEKIRRYYSKNGELDKPIIVTKKGMIVDGYIRYLVAKENGLENVEVKVVNTRYYDSIDNGEIQIITAR